MVEADFPVVPGYTILDHAGSGGAGDVFRARSEESGEIVAVKILRDPSSDDGDLRHEYQVLSALDHPSLARMLACGKTGSGHPFLVMSWTEGAAMNRALFLHTDGTFDNRAFARAILRVAEALVHIHVQGVIHGDLKPANILIRRGDDGSIEATVMDFGLSRHARDGRNGLAGTAEYLAPELIRGDEPGVGSDLYALGCTLYECIAGDPPFTGADLTDVLARHVRETPAPPSAEGIDATIQSWILTLLEKDPALRFRGAARLAAEAATYLGLESAARPDAATALRLPKVPREQELAKLHELRAQSETRARIALVEGSTGAGKTTLLKDLRTSLVLDGIPVLALGPRTGDEPFAPILRGIRTQARTRYDNTLLPEAAVIAAAFPGALPGVAPASLQNLTPDALKLRVFLAASILLTDGSEPRALLFEDFDVADELTREFLLSFVSYLHARENAGCFLVITADAVNAANEFTQLAEIPGTTRIPIPPLSPDALSASIRGLLGKALSPSFLSILLRQSSGLPGRVEELLSFCLSEGVLEATPHGWLVHERDNLAGIFPASVEDQLRRTITRLDADTRNVLAAVALSPAPVPFTCLVEVCARPAAAITSDLGLLHSAGLVAHDNYAVWAANTAVSNAAQPSAAEAQQVHDRLYAWHNASRTPDPYVRAVHAYASSTPENALDDLLEAAQIRARRFDIRKAEELFVAALTLLKAPSQAEARFSTLSSLIDIVNMLGRRDAEEEYLEEMLVLGAQSGNPERLADVYRHQTEYYISVAEFDRARKSAEKALAYATQAGDRHNEAYCHRKLGFIEYRTRPGQAVVDHYTRALAVYESDGSTSDAGQVLVDIGLVYYSILDDPPKALEHFARARTLFENAGDKRGLIRAEGNTGAQLYSLGLYEEAHEHQVRANAIAREIGDRRFLATSLGSLAQCELALCRYSEALLHLNEELRISREIRDKYLEELCLENTGELYLSLGEYDKSIAAYSDAKRLAAESGNEIGSIACDIDIAGGMIENRDTDAAAKLLRAARAALTELHDVNVEAMLLYRTGMLHIARGPLHDADRALEAFRALGDLADAQDFRSHRILARSYAGRCLMLSGRHAEGEALSSAAVALLDEGGPLYGGAADVLLNHALVLRAQRSAEAVVFVDRAYAELMRVAEMIDDVHLYRSFLERVRVNAEIVREYTLAHRGDSKDAISAVREQNLRTLYEVARKINSVLDLPPLLENIMDSALEAMNGERGLIFFIEDEQLVLKVSRNVEKETIEDATAISLSILRDVVAGGKPIIVADTAQSEEFRNRESVRNFNIHSLVCVPMRSKSRLIGTVYVDSRSDALRAISFSDIDAEFLEAFANLATIAIENARLHASLREENLYLRKAMTRQFGFENIIGDSDIMQRLFSETQGAISTDGAVLISGESGTGKELVAKAIHFNGARKDRRFVAVDCGALPDTLLESELFGYKRGAFTGAYTDKPGLFEEAHDGTLFLDEISNTSLAFQAKLLRVLQDGEFRRVGDTAVRRVNVRIICATNKHLDAEIEEGRFRQDLFYRLNVIPITVPSLRDRVGDVPLLVQHFIAKYAEKHPTPVTGASSELIETLQRCPWKGNVRELENLINRMMTQATEPVLSTRSLPTDYQQYQIDTAPSPVGDYQVTFKSAPKLVTLQQAEREHILNVLQHVKGNRTEASKILGLKRTTLIEKMKKLGIM